MILLKSVLHFEHTFNNKKDEISLKTCECQLNKLPAHTSDLTLFKSLPKAHMLRTLILEHARIYAFLGELTTVGKQLDAIDSLDDNPGIAVQLRYLVDHLLRSERHHIREENVLIRRLDKLKVYIPGNEIRKQHDVLRVKKRELENLVYRIHTMYFADFKKEAKRAILQAVSGLQEHIKLEDSTLFSTALKHIPEDEWAQMKKECDTIGYCCFTPNKDTDLIEIL